jgi:hypothetical protein
MNKATLRLSMRSEATERKRDGEYQAPRVKMFHHPIVLPSLTPPIETQDSEMAEPDVITPELSAQPMPRNANEEEGTGEDAAVDHMWTSGQCATENPNVARPPRQEK